MTVSSIFTVSFVTNIVLCISSGHWMFLLVVLTLPLHGLTS